MAGNQISFTIYHHKVSFYILHGKGWLTTEDVRTNVCQAPTLVSEGIIVPYEVLAQCKVDQDYFSCPAQGEGPMIGLKHYQ